MKNQFSIDDAARFKPGGRHLWAGHKGMFNVLFVDGHAKSMKPQQSAAYVDTLPGSSAQQPPVVNNIPRNLWYRKSSKPLSANGVGILNKCVGD